jgi:hypothetical protein
MSVKLATQSSNNSLVRLLSCITRCNALTFQLSLFPEGRLRSYNHLESTLTETLLSYQDICRMNKISPRFGRAIAQAVSLWFPTAAARVQTRVWSSWICGGQSCAGAGFLRVLRFPLPIIITQGRYKRPFSGRRAEWTQYGLHPPLCKFKRKL